MSDKKYLNGHPGDTSKDNNDDYYNDLDTYATAANIAPNLTSSTADKNRDSLYSDAPPPFDSDGHFYPVNTSGKNSYRNSAASSRDDRSLDDMEKYHHDSIYTDAPPPPQHYLQDEKGNNQYEGYPPPPPPPPPAQQQQQQPLPVDLQEQRTHLITPYVGKWAKISRVWISQLIITLIFIGLNNIFMANQAREMAQTAISELNLVCLSLENAADQVLNAPRTVAVSTVTMIQDAARRIVEVTAHSLIKTLDMLKTIIIWVLKLYVGTYICIAEVIVQTALAVVADVGKMVTDLLNKAVNSVVSNLQGVASDVAGALQDTGNKIANFFTGGNDDKPTFDFHEDQIRKDLDIHIPDDWVNSIKDISNKIPTEDEIFGNVTKILSIPFDMLSHAILGGFEKVDINLVEDAHFPDKKYSNMCATPIGEKTIHGFGEAAYVIMFIAGAVVIGLAALVFAFNVYWVYRGERRFHERLIIFRKDLVENNQARLQDVGTSFLESRLIKVAKLGKEYIVSKQEEREQQMAMAPSAMQEYSHELDHTENGMIDGEEYYDANEQRIRKYKDQVGQAGQRVGAMGKTAMGEARNKLVRFQQALNETKEERVNELRQALLDSKELLTRDEIMTKAASVRELDLFILPGRPFFDRIVRKVRDKWGRSERVNMMLWYMDYLWYLSAWSCLIAGVIGIISMFVQIWFINKLRAKYIPMLAHDLDEFQYKFLDQTILGGVRNDSQSLARNINTSINNTQDTLNTALTGPIDKGTSSLNNTLNDFVNTYISGIRSVFHDTPLDKAIEGLVNCTLTKNIRSIQKILTFVHDLVGEIDLPHVKESVLLHPVEELLEPLEKGANKLRKLAVGVHIPNATALDPNDFPDQSEIDSRNEASSLAAKSSSMYKDRSSRYSDFGGDSSHVASDNLDNDSDTIPNIVVVNRRDNPFAANMPGQTQSDESQSTAPPSDAPLPTPRSQVESAASTTQNNDWLNVNIPGTELPTTTSSDEDSDDESSELENLDDEFSSGFNDSIAWVNVSRENVIDAQKDGGYTGGVLGELCDKYIATLYGQLPMYLTLIGCWVVLVLMGSVPLARNYHKIKVHERTN